MRSVTEEEIGTALRNVIIKDLEKIMMMTSEEIDAINHCNGDSAKEIIDKTINKQVERVKTDPALYVPPLIQSLENRVRGLEKLKVSNKYSDIDKDIERVLSALDILKSLLLA